MTTNILLIGNPGAGKSYLLNSIGGSFPSGFCVVDGLTTTCTYCDVEVGTSRVRLIDVPGLLEATDEKTARNCQEITKALQMNGTFKLIFVLVECAGRVSPLDLYTIGKVMSSIDFSIDVGVIVNKVPDEDVEDYERGRIRDEIIQMLNSMANNRIRHAWYVVLPRFRADDKISPRRHMDALLHEMTSQGIPTVTNITVEAREYNYFLDFLLTVKTWVVGLWSLFLQYLVPVLVQVAVDTLTTL